MRTRVPHPRGFAAAALCACAVTALASCGSSGGGVKAPTIGAARTFKLAHFEPTSPIRAGTSTRLSFTIQQPDGAPLTKYKTGAGPHTGVHLIIVRDDLADIIHRHPPVGTNGAIAEPLRFPAPGKYRVLVDAYPNISATLPNFQLFDHLTVAGAWHPRKLPPFRSTVTTGGYTFHLHGRPHLKAVTPAFLDITVTGPGGRRASFTPWYGALAHAIFFRAGTLDYFHTHVCGAGAANCTSTLGASKITGHSTTPGKLSVGVLLPISGTWRLFLQCKVEGHVLTAPFTLKVS
jgi:hypothetical protein